MHLLQMKNRLWMQSVWYIGYRFRWGCLPILKQGYLSPSVIRQVCCHLHQYRETWALASQDNHFLLSHKSHIITAAPSFQGNQDVGIKKWRQEQSEFELSFSEMGNLVGRTHLWREKPDVSGTISLQVFIG